DNSYQRHIDSQVARNSGANACDFGILSRARQRPGKSGGFVARRVRGRGPALVAIASLLVDLNAASSAVHKHLPTIRVRQRGGEGSTNLSQQRVSPLSASSWRATRARSFSLGPHRRQDRRRHKRRAALWL